MHKQDQLIDALNHLDEYADMGSDTTEEKSDLQKSYNFLFNFILQASSEEDTITF